MFISAIYVFRIWVQDVSQEYLQASEKLGRKLFIKPTAEFQLSEDKLLSLLKPLYGLSDSGDYWNNALAKHLTQDVKMIPSTGGLSLYSRRGVDGIIRVVASYIDDTIYCGTKEFEEESKVTAETFKSSERICNNVTFARM